MLAVLNRLHDVPVPLVKTADLRPRHAGLWKNRSNDVSTLLRRRRHSQVFTALLDLRIAVTVIAWTHDSDKTGDNAPNQRLSLAPGQIPCMRSRPVNKRLQSEGKLVIPSLECNRGYKQHSGVKAVTLHLGLRSLSPGIFPGILTGTNGFARSKTLLLRRPRWKPGRPGRPGPRAPCSARGHANSTCNRIRSRILLWLHRNSSTARAMPNAGTSWNCIHMPNSNGT